MTELEHSYRTDTLSAEELQLLRQKVNSSPDDAIASHMLDEWLHEDIDMSSVEDERLSLIKTKIDQATRHTHFDFSLFKRIGSIAAAVLLPLFILTTLYFYKENRQLTSEEMVVTTGPGERANITLPDGTGVALNANSRLSYTPKVYNKTYRQIDFDGEGYFKVHKDANRPFVIDARGLQVKVLGTVFDLKVGKHDLLAELALEQGKVQFLSVKTNKDVILEAGSKAVLDQATGNITVLKDKQVANKSAWKRGTFAFHETTLSDIISTLESNYGIDIQVGDTIALSDSFTGNLPVSNLDEALLILQKSYHFKCTRKGKHITLAKN